MRLNRSQELYRKRRQTPFKSTMKIPLRRLLSPVFVSIAVGVLLAGCMGGSGSEGGGDAATGIGETSGALRLNPNVRIGEVIWVNDGGDFVVVQMDAPRNSFEAQFFLALDPAGQQVSGVLIGGGDVQGRSFGARVLEGTVFEGSEVRNPSPEWTQYLFESYNQTERLPATREGTF